MAQPLRVHDAVYFDAYRTAPSGSIYSPPKPTQVGCRLLWSTPNRAIYQRTTFAEDTKHICTAITTNKFSTYSALPSHFRGTAVKVNAAFYC